MSEDEPVATAAHQPWWRVQDAARHARCGPKVIYRAAASGRLRVVRLGGRRELRLRREWVDAWLEGQVVGVEQAP